MAVEVLIGLAVFVWTWLWFVVYRTVAASLDVHSRLLVDAARDVAAARAEAAACKKATDQPEDGAA